MKMRPSLPSAVAYLALACLVAETRLKLFALRKSDAERRGLEQSDADVLSAAKLLAPVPGLTAPSGAFSGKPAGAQYRAQPRGRAPEPRWGRAVPHSLRPEVAGSPCWLLARAWRILAVVFAVQDAHNWNAAFHLWASAAARLGHLDRS